MYINEELWGKVQSEPKEKILEEPEKGLQPDTLDINVHLSLPHATEGAGVRKGSELHQVHTHAHGSMKQLPTNIPGGPGNQGGMQTGPPGSACS